MTLAEVEYHAPMDTSENPWLVTCAVLPLPSVTLTVAETKSSPRRARTARSSASASAPRSSADHEA